MEDGRLELDQQTGMMAVDATRQDETADRSTRTADVWRRAGRWGGWKANDKDVQG
jgi:hypothetical protein